MRKNLLIEIDDAINLSHFSVFCSFYLSSCFSFQSNRYLEPKQSHNLLPFSFPSSISSISLISSISSDLHLHLSLQSHYLFGVSLWFYICCLSTSYFFWGFIIIWITFVTTVEIDQFTCLVCFACFFLTSVSFLLRHQVLLCLSVYLSLKYLIQILNQNLWNAKIQYLQICFGNNLFRLWGCVLSFGATCLWSFCRSLCIFWLHDQSLRSRRCPI